MAFNSGTLLYGKQKTNWKCGRRNRTADLQQEVVERIEAEAEMRRAKDAAELASRAKERIPGEHEP